MNFTQKTENGKYIFTLGKDEENPRIYSGMLLRPYEGFKLGLRVAKELAKMYKDSGKDTAYLGGLYEKIKTQDNELGLVILSELVEVLSILDISTYFELLDYILENTSLHAKRDKDRDSTPIRNKSEFNKWFGDCPADIPLFSAQIIGRNAAPFFIK